MISVIRGRTRRRYQDAEKEAGKVPGLEAALIAAREASEAHRKQLGEVRALLDETERRRAAEVRTSLGLRTELARAQEAGAEIAAALTRPDDLLSDVVLTIARTLVRHADVLGLEPRQILSERNTAGPSALPAGSEAGAGLQDLSGAFRYAHESEEPWLIGDHAGAGRCEACTAALPLLDDETLADAYRAASLMRNHAGAKEIRDEIASRDGDADGGCGVFLARLEASVAAEVAAASGA